MKKRFLFLLITAIFTVLTAWANENKNFVLVIDAGHGGHDAGAVGSFSKEKNINLNVALAFGKLVEQNCPDVKVIYTRKTDVFVTLDGRAQIANKAKADLFISIHTNALPEGRLAYGSETYTLGMHRADANLAVAKRENSVITYESNYKTKYEGFDPNKAESYIIFEFMQDKFMKQSVDLAKCIQQQYVRSNRYDKGVHQAGFLVLRKTSMPAVLTELGFITTPEEEKFLNSESGIRTLATCIYNGFLAYRKFHGDKNVPDMLTVQKAEKSRFTLDDNDDAEVVPMNAVNTKNAKQEPAPTAEQGKKSNAATNKKETTESKAKDTVAKPKENAAKPKETETQKKEVATKQKETPAKQKETTTKPAANSAKPKEKAQTSTPQAKQNSTQQNTSEKKQENTEKGTVYRIQFAVTSKPLDSNDKRFKDLKNIYSYQDGSQYKHTTGRFSSISEARTALKEVQKIVPDAFIVKFVDGKRQ